jgi:hypothetical protein
MPSRQAAVRAYELLHLDRELTPEENLELAACMVEPTSPYIA